MNRSFFSMLVVGLSLSAWTSSIPAKAELAAPSERFFLETIAANQAAEEAEGAEAAVQQFTAAQSLYRNGQFEEALVTYRNALAEWKALGNATETARTLYEIGRALRKLDKYPEAIDSFRQAIAIFAAIDDPRGQADAINGIGQVYQSLGQLDDALPAFQQALEIFQQLDDGIRQGYTLNNLGVIYRDLGQYAQALSFYQQAALALAEDEVRSSIVVLNNLGVLYAYLGQYESALTSLQQALALSQQHAYNIEVGDSLHNIGFVYRNQGRYDQALAAYQQALEIRQGLESRSGEAETLNNLGYVYNLLGQDEAAVAVLDRAIGYYQELGDLGGEGRTLDTLASVYSHRGETQLGLTTYLQALILLQQVGDRRAEIAARSNLGELFASQGQVELAILFYKQAVNLTETIRQDIRALPVEEQATYNKTVADTYRQLADLLLQQDRVLEAQRVLDLLKLQELDSSLAGVRGDPAVVTDIALRPQERTISEGSQRRLDQAVAAADELQMLRQILPQERSADQNQKILELELLQGQLLEDFITFIEGAEVQQLVERLSRTAQQQDLLTELDRLPNLQDNLADIGQAALLYPLILDDRLELVLVTASGPPIHYAVPVARAELSQAILEFQAALRDRTSDPQPLAQALYQWLIAPLDHALAEAGVDTLLYAPDGLLRYIPLAALHDGNQWLIQHYQINHITAASLTDLNLHPSAEPLVLAGAFSQGEYRVTMMDRTLVFTGLPYAGVEVDLLSQAFPTQTLFNADFSRRATEPLLNDYNIVHLATHAALLVDFPLESFILFGNGDRLTLADLKQWRGRLRGVDLVVLSACETGTGSVRDATGEEILGFGYLMQDAGARAVMASLWPVSDGGTQELMINFYQALQIDGMTKAAALQQAQIALITGNQVENDRGQRFALISRNSDETWALPQGQLSHPYYWAPFILIGNGL